MNVEFFMQYAAYALMAVGVLSFFVSVIVQVVKELPGLKDIPTSMVALAVSLILCLAAVTIACQYFKMKFFWYYGFASVMSSFIVYLVATGGWERIAEIWNRTKYHSKQ